MKAGQTMGAYYNENDPAAAEWLRELISRGLIADGEVDERSILDVTPGDVAGFDQAHFFAGIGGWSLALRRAGWPDDRPVWTGSAPCFTAGTLITTLRGFIPIEEVIVGDDVLTHKHRWKPVVAVGDNVKDTAVLKGQGHFGITTTANHPFLSITRSIQSTKVNGVPVRKHTVSRESWTAASDMPGKWWAMPDRYPKNEVATIPDSADKLSLAWLAGAYVGDGWTGAGGRKNSIMFGVNEEKSTDIRRKICSLGFTPMRHEQKTGVRITFTDSVVAKWLVANFCKGSRKKSLPLWLMSEDYSVKKSFLDGWMHTDGTREKWYGCSRLTTVSRHLAVTGRALLVSMGFSVSMRYIETPATTVIEGRTVNQADYYTISYSNNDRYKINVHGKTWFKAKKYLATGRSETVYNLHVEGDNSYCADGIIVHNCQPFSSAGKQAGPADDRHLWPAFHWLISQCSPERIFGEQVASGPAMDWLDHVSTDLEGEGYACGSIVFPACCLGSPHLRQRLYWVAESSREQYDGAGDSGARRGAEYPDGCAIGSVGNTDCEGLERSERQRAREERPPAERTGRPCSVANTEGKRSEVWTEAGGRSGESDDSGEACGVADADGGNTSAKRKQRSGINGQSQEDANPLRLANGRQRGCDDEELPRPGPTNGRWADADWIFCTDGKWRAVEHGTFPLVYGKTQPLSRSLADELPAGMGPGGDSCASTNEARTMRLRGYGNAIVVEQAAAFIRAAQA